MKHDRKHRLWDSYQQSLATLLKQGGTKHNHSHQIHLSTSQSIARTFIRIFVVGFIGLTVAVLSSRQFFGGGGLNFSDSISYLLVFYSLYFVVAVIALAFRNTVFKKSNIFVELATVTTLQVLVTSLSLLHIDSPQLWLACLVLGLVMMLASRFEFRSYSYSGINFYLSMSLMMIVGLAWGADFFISMEAGLLTKTLLLSATPLLLVSVPSGFVSMLEMYDVLCKDHWRKIRHPYPKSLHAKLPFVSLQVPTYSEPPEVVINTLNVLAGIDYHNYEVIVIDNNTEDANLWKPVEEHCKKLGSRFRFFHIDNLPGAKAGALNYINQYCDPKTEIIGVIDADYEADKGFLRELVGYFEDKKLGFIQTPHDYREWKDNLFLTMCYWEYKIFFHSTMVSLNERDSGITVGTMCLLRKEAFDRAGGWSEWCVTEDSELAIRIHDQGYSSIYVDKTYGRGLIPDSFEGYKKQRYRWTAGPVQEFRHYYRHFLGFSKRKSNFSFIQRVFHLNHGLANTLTAFNVPVMIVGLATVVSMIANDEVVAVPIELWIAASITLVSSPILILLLYKVTVKATISEILEQSLATKALSHVVLHASLRTAITGKAKWTRTSKFKSQQSIGAALYSTKEEITIGVLLLTFAVISYTVFSSPGLANMLLIGVVYVAIGYFAAPLMALIGVWSFKRTENTDYNNSHLQK